MGDLLLIPHGRGKGGEVEGLWEGEWGPARVETHRKRRRLQHFAFCILQMVQVERAPHA